MPLIPRASDRWNSLYCKVLAREVFSCNAIYTAFLSLVIIILHQNILQYKTIRFTAYVDVVEFM